MASNIFLSLVLFLVLSSIQKSVSEEVSIEDMNIILERRIQDIIRTSHYPNLADRWRNELTSEGIWNDVDYTHGCPASRADWKAVEHFRRIITMACQWYHDEFDVDLLSKIHLAMDYWFTNDFTEDDCINGGSVDRLKCPCGTPGFWNPNWWYQMILMPKLVGNACLMMNSALTEPQRSKCINQTKRSYDRIDGDPNGMMGKMTGANLLDVTWGGASLALLTSDQELLLDTLSRSYNESELTYGFQDGIKVDGSFMQHSGQLLTGSYGSVFITQMIKIFMETQGTVHEPPLTVQSAFLTLINGSEWFMYHKNDTEDQYSPLVMWEYSVIGRSISHKYSDWRSIGFNLNQLINSTRTWSNHASLVEIVDRLQTGQSVNPGGLVGTRYFHVTDYLVHRGMDYITTLKMFSKRTTNSECHNSQNPFGFHLSDGSLFTYLTGNEYTDVAGAWDWYLVPGTTVDHGATDLLCSKVEFKGKESFVGGLAMGQAGVAVMNYTNPNTGSLSWTKTYFFFPKDYIVQFVGESRTTHPTAPVVTTLDQRHQSGEIYIDGVVVEDLVTKRTARSLWHDRVGYEFFRAVNLTVDTTPRQSNWSAIGTSEGNETMGIMAAYFEHTGGSEDEQLSYMATMNIPFEDFKRRDLGITKSRIIHGLASESNLAAIVRGATYGLVNTPERTVNLVFLTAGTFSTGLDDLRIVESDAPILLIFQRNENNDGWKLGLADPSQELSQVSVKVWVGEFAEPVMVNSDLPSGAWAGSKVVYDF